jgi:hypothetical protein
MPVAPIAVTLNSEYIGPRRRLAVPLFVSVGSASVMSAVQGKYGAG